MKTYDEIRSLSCQILNKILMDLCGGCNIGKDIVFVGFYEEQVEVVVYVLESLRLYGIKTERVTGTDDLLVHHG